MRCDRDENWRSTLILRHPRRHMCLLAVLGFWLVVGCSSVTLPPVTTAAPPQSHPGKFVWNDLLTDDVTRARRFYGELLGWEFETVTPDYVTIRLRSVPIGGIARRDNLDPATPDSIWLCSLSVADVDKATERAKAGGGSVVQGPETIPGRGQLAVVRDAGGALLVLLQSPHGDPPDHAPATNSWVWNDLFTRDVETSIDFYSRLIGYTVKHKTDSRRADVFLYGGGHARAGIIAMPWRGVRPNWLPYIGVDDLEAILKRAQSLGGDVLVRSGDAAILIDPTGAAVGLQQINRRP